MLVYAGLLIWMCPFVWRCLCALVHACLSLLIYEGLCGVRVCVFTNLVCIWTCVSTYTACPTDRTDCTISSTRPYTLKNLRHLLTLNIFRFTDLGADAFLRFQLRTKLRAIKEDDRYRHFLPSFLSSIISSFFSFLHSSFPSFFPFSFPSCLLSCVSDYPLLEFFCF